MPVRKLLDICYSLIRNDLLDGWLASKYIAVYTSKRLKIISLNTKDTLNISIRNCENVWLAYGYLFRVITNNRSFKILRRDLLRPTYLGIDDRIIFQLERLIHGLLHVWYNSHNNRQFLVDGELEEESDDDAFSWGKDISSDEEDETEDDTSSDEYPPVKRFRAGSEDDDDDEEGEEAPADGFNSSDEDIAGSSANGSEDGDDEGSDGGNGAGAGP